MDDKKSASAVEKSGTRKKGRRTRIDEKTKQQALDLIKTGASAKDVSRKTGVSYPTAINWARALRGETPLTKRSTRGANAADEMELLKMEVEFLRRKVAFFEAKFGQSS